jgi:ADP-ribose pyrophosphatase
MSIKKLSSREIYRNKWMVLREDKIERVDGSQGIYGVVTKPDFSLIIPVEGECFHLVEQFRYPVQGRYLEFPQGTWEERPEATPEAVAAGELREETGLIAGRMTYLGHLFVAYGFVNQGMHVFLAEGLTQGERSLTPEEADLVCRKVPIEEFDRLIARGEIKDIASLAAYTLLRIKGALKRPLGC